MRSCFLILALSVISFTPRVGRAAVVQELSFKFESRVSPDPLTTEKASEGLDLGIQTKNPHRQAWILNRKVDWVGLKPIHLLSPPKKIRDAQRDSKKDSKGDPKGDLKSLDEGAFQEVFGIQAEGILADTTAWIRSLAWFETLKKTPCCPGRLTLTEEESKRQVAQAVRSWSDLLDQRRYELALRLSKVRTQSSEIAIKEGNEILTRWLGDTNQLWQRKLRKELDRKEVKICPSQMDPLVGKAVTQDQMLVRLPVRLWDHWFSIRVNFHWSGHSLNGRFLIDPTAPKSVVSPDWLTNQGIIPALIQVPKVPPERVRGSQFADQQLGSLVPIVDVEKVVVSGFTIPLKRFLLTETDFFAPPDFVGTCCDGVLGADFLALYPVEFQSSQPPELRLWPRKNFERETDAPWSEVSQNDQGQLVTQCGSKPLPLDARLSSQPFTLDLPHGRLWLSKGSSSKIPAEEKPPRSKQGRKAEAGQKGLVLEYRLEDGDRVLFVSAIEKNSYTRSLVRAGLKAGMIVDQINGRDVSEMDAKEVQEILAGKEENVVSLLWKTKEGPKMASLQLP